MNEEEEMMESIRKLTELEAMREEIRTGEALKLRGVKKGLFLLKLRHLESIVKRDWPDHQVNLPVIK